MSDNKDLGRRDKHRACRGPSGYQPPWWLSTEDLEQELVRAVMTDSNRPLAQTTFECIDAYFAADEPETEVEYRRSLLRLLADLRPQLAELIGGPRKCE